MECANPVIRTLQIISLNALKYCSHLQSLGRLKRLQSLIISHIYMIYIVSDESILYGHIILECFKALGSAFVVSDEILLGER